MSFCAGNAVFVWGNNCNFAVWKKESRYYMSLP